MQIRENGVQAGAQNAERPAGEHHALVVKAAHQHFHAAPDFADDIFRRHFHAVKNQFGSVGAAHAEFVQFAPAADAESALHQKGGDAARAGLRVGFRIDHDDIGVGPVGDPHLAAVQHITAAGFFRAQLHADHIRAGAAFRHGQRADLLAANQRRQVFAAQLFAGVQADLVDAQIGMRAVTQPDRGRGAADFLHRHHMREVAHAGAAVFGRRGDSEQAEFAHLAPQFVRELVGAVDFGGARRDALGGERGRAFAQQFHFAAVAAGR